MAARIALLPLLALLFAACGPAREPTYDLEKTKSCLSEKGAKIGGDLDFVASTATGGAFHVTLPDNEVTLVFGETTDDAQQIEKAYIRFRGRNIGIADILKRMSNVVMLWKEHPEQLDLETVEGCLTS